MAKLIYGNGTCNIEGENIRGVQIFKIGNTAIVDKTPDGYELMQNDNQILIFGLTSSLSLTELFEYEGELNIIKVIVADKDGNSVSTIIKKVMDYSELIDSESEYLTVKSEEFNRGYVYKNKLKESSINKPIITNQHTSSHDGELYKKDGSLYEGSFHIHKNNRMAMSGSNHTEESEELYTYKKGILTSTKQKIVTKIKKILSKGSVGGY